MKRRFKHGSKLATDVDAGYRKFMERRGLHVPKKWGRQKVKKCQP